MEFGTGAVAVTAHSKIGYEIAKNHHVPLLQVINESGLIKNSENFNDVMQFKCRQVLIEKLYEMGLLKEVLPYQMMLPVCTLTGDVINYLPKEQCFLSCRQLNEKAAEVVRTGKLKILPERYIQNWLDLTGNASDWCISRQLWWGHQIPMYKCTTDEKSVWVAADDKNAALMEAFVLLETLPNLIKIERDKDVLDPWFTSSVYAFSALGFPRGYQRRNVLESFPLNLTVAGQDLLELWVHRMVILNLALTDKLPFNKVLVHGTVCDSDGAKICKQRGNMIDPDDVVYGVPFDALTYRYEEMQREGLLSKAELDRISNYYEANFANTDGIPRCGADALRFTLLSQDIKSDTINFNIASCYENKLFCNKVWQCVIKAQQYYEKLKKTDEKITIRDLTYFDKWILSKLANMVYQANKSIASYDFHVAAKALKTFIDKELCDVYMEGTKLDFENKNPKQAYAYAHTMSVALNTSLRCLSPFMVHLTDELIPRVPGFRFNIIHNFKDTSNKVLNYPKYADFKVWKDAAVEKRVGELLSAVKVVKNIKGLYNITSELVPCVYINTEKYNLKSDILNNKNVVLNLTQCVDVKFEEPPRENIIKTMFDQNTEIAVALEKEEARQILTVARYKLEKKIERLEVILSNLKVKYSSEEYLRKTALDVQLADRERLEAKKKKLEDLQKLL
ncbi:unnamed protein product [Arctia plantaginis]|uniref:valine--tRNA ligase n=1 Tax=Arctia plantaginis TaxID=874455 RepID=A0A8S1AR19_ARCPL|nr:unnamed protein product [Arctia plantaginis]